MGDVPKDVGDVVEDVAVADDWIDTRNSYLYELLEKLEEDDATNPHN